MREVVVEKISVKSSIINYLIYNHQKLELEVFYKNGKHRVYEDFSAADLKYVMESSSVGKALLSRVKKDLSSKTEKKSSFFAKLFSF